MTIARHAHLARLGAALVLAATTAACNIFIELHDDDEPVDGNLVVFDAAIDAPIDAPFDQANCDLELPCPAPEDGKATLCGRLWDTETDLQLRAATTTGARCTAITGDGPCSLTLKFYDALDFAMNPAAAVPLTPQEHYVDECGRYRGINLPRATFGFIGVSVDDAPTTADRHALSAVATSNGLSTPGMNFRVYATRHTTDALWTSSAGLVGPSFAERGVLVEVFRFYTTPTPGVSVRRNGALIPADDHYFSDTGSNLRRTVSPSAASTGANGTALVINSSSPIAHDGVGGEPVGCRWPSNLGASIPGVVFVQLKDAEDPNGALCDGGQI